jgi:RNA polymerase sigma factor (sigma-70 family)
MVSDPRALEELYEDLAEPLRLFIAGRYGRLGITYQDAEEIANDALVKVHTTINSFRPEEGSLKTYLFNIARRKAVDLLRKRSRTRKGDALDAAARSALTIDKLTYKDYPARTKTATPDFARAVEKAEESAPLWDAINKLTPMERDILVNDWCMQDKELAHRYNTTAGNIRVICHRAAEKVRRALGRAKKQ